MENTKFCFRWFTPAINPVPIMQKMLREINMELKFIETVFTNAVMKD